MIEHPGDELVDVPASDRPLRMCGARGARAVQHLAGVLVERQALEHQRAADHVAAESGGGVTVGGLGLTVRRETAVGPGQQVLDDVLADQALAYENAKQLGAKQPLDEAGIEVRKPLEGPARGEKVPGQRLRRWRR